MKRWLVSVAAAIAITAGSTIAAAGPALAAAPGSASVQQATIVAAKDFCSGQAPKKKKTPSRPFNNLDWLGFGYRLVAAPAKDSDLCPILA